MRYGEVMVAVHLYSPVSLRVNGLKVRVPAESCDKTTRSTNLCHTKLLMAGANESSPRTSHVRVKFDPSSGGPLAVMMADNSGAGQYHMGTIIYIHRNLNLPTTVTLILAFALTSNTIPSQV